MHRLSVGFTDEQLDWIESRADAEDRSNAEIVRRAVDAVRTGADRTDADRTGANHITAGEIEELKERVAALEEQIADPPETSRSADPVSPSEPPGSGGEDPTPDLVKWARANQPVSRQDVLDWAAPRVDIKPISWWKRHGRAQLKDYGAEFRRNVGWRFPLEE